MMRFPEGFLWGAATSAYQVEGGNANSDWWEWEISRGLSRSGQACRHYELYERDFDLAKALHHNAHRLSIEWGRIEPEPGRFSSLELQHYLRVVMALKERGIEPVVTLHHFTNPLWFYRLGGWENNSSRNYFLRYVREAVNILSPHVNFWVTINEPMIYIFEGYIAAEWPPQKRSLPAAAKALPNLIAAHIGAYRVIHKIYKDKGMLFPRVSIAQSVRAFVPCGDSLKNRTACWLRDKAFNRYFLERALAGGALDFIGLNYYTRDLVDVDSWSPKKIALQNCRHGHDPVSKNSLGWDIYPAGLYRLLMDFRRYRLPLFILENGISTADDRERWGFIEEHLRFAWKAIQEGSPLIGYLYWSLIDNFEWHRGFTPRFGITEVDYHTYERRPRESALQYAAVCERNSLE